VKTGSNANDNHYHLCLLLFSAAIDILSELYNLIL